eukprot:TRINITY_DN1625_c0_g1_i1.p1 TRINITY_DN1625_c0_g1~~TRINITY_DN1625_c0_g1_i1.p1  ORF type:complete len:456 (-),score=108.95 TRINITY_DN1625_c0_g1_i1:56-1423(-)
MTRGGEGIRVSMGIFVLVLIAFSSVVALALLLRFHKQQPFRTRGWSLMWISVLGSLVHLSFHIREIMGPENVNCTALLWATELWAPLFFAPNIASGWRLLRLITFERMKGVLAKGQMTPQQIAEIAMLRNQLDAINSLSYVLLSCVPFLAVSLIASVFSVGGGSLQDSDGCRSGLIGTIGALFSSAVFVVPTVVLLIRLWGSSDGFGIINEMLLLLITTTCFLGPYIFLNLATSERINHTRFPTGYLISCLVLIWQISSCHIPAFHLLVKEWQDKSAAKTATASGENGASVGTTNEEALRKLLSTDLGVRYFTLHLEAEFSGENGQFYAAVEEFKKNPTFSTARSIWNTYLLNDAPLQVNVSFATQQACKPPETDPLSPLSHSLFDKAQEEVFKLMASDSYARFVKGTLYSQLLIVEGNKRSHHRKTFVPAGSHFFTRSASGKNKGNPEIDAANV